MVHLSTLSIDRNKEGGRALDAFAAELLPGALPSLRRLQCAADGSTGAFHNALERGAMPVLLELAVVSGDSDEFQARFEELRPEAAAQGAARRKRK